MRVACCLLVHALLSLPCMAFADEPGIALTDSVFTIPSEDGSDTLTARRLTFSGAVHNAVYDSSGILVISYGTEKLPWGGGQRLTESIVLVTQVAYDLAAHRVLWTKHEHEIVSRTFSNRVLMKTEKGGALYGLSDGKKLMGFEGDLLIDEAHDLVLVAGGHTITAFRMNDWDVAWEVDREGVTGPASLTTCGERIVVDAEGIQVLDAQTGAGWTYRVPASRPSVFLEPEGGFVSLRTIGSLFGIKQVRSLGADPLVRDGRIYFAAETTVVCLGLDTGSCLWRRALRRGRGFSLKQRAMGLPATPEFLGKLIVRDAGPSIVVASLGWAPGKDNIWLADRPTIALLDKHDGRVSHRVALEGIDILRDVRSTPAGLILVAPDRMIRMDDSLVVHQVHRRSSTTSKLLGILPCGGPMLAIATGDIAAMRPESLGIAWQRNQGYGAAWSSPWDAAALASDGVVDSSVAADSLEYRWIISTAGLTGVDPSNGCKPARFYRMAGSTRTEIRDRMVLAYAGRSVTILPLPRRRR